MIGHAVIDPATTLPILLTSCIPVFYEMMLEMQTELYFPETVILTQ